jgi:rod shape-determining protein MreB
MRSLFSLFSSDLAIDLGTSNTLVFSHGKGIVVNEPPIVAINKVSGEVVAVGREAKEMLGRTPGNVVVIKPMKDGVIADFKVTEKMLTYFIQKAHNRHVLVRPRIVIGVPSEITPVEKRAVQDSAYRARGPAKCISLSRPWRRRSARACQSKSLWETWWSTSAEARRTSR